LRATPGWAYGSLPYQLSVCGRQLGAGMGKRRAALARGVAMGIPERTDHDQKRLTKRQFKHDIKHSHVYAKRRRL